MGCEQQLNWQYIYPKRETDGKTDMARIIGRRKERDDLTEFCRSRKAELVGVYGRRRVGKTYLVENAFRGRMAFSATGSENRRMRTQLRVSHEALRSRGLTLSERQASMHGAAIPLKS